MEEKSLENWGLPELEKPSTAVPQTGGDEAVGVQSLSSWAPMKPKKDVQPRGRHQVYCRPPKSIIRNSKIAAFKMGKTV